jgi:hypothetical protein
VWELEKYGPGFAFSRAGGQVGVDHRFLNVAVAEPVLYVWRQWVFPVFLIFAHHRCPF